MKKICVVTGTRAEYGLLRPLIDEIIKDEQLKLQLVVTGMHLSTEFGLTYRQIEEEGYTIDDKIEVILSSDTPVGIGKSMGLGMISFSESIERLKPDLIIVLGDRYEIFACVCAAMVARIPIAHLHGGELTEGLIDEAIRHCITKMSQLHFTSTENYRRRVIQLGEHPDRVFNVGAIGIENIYKMKLLSKNELEEQIGFLMSDTILVTFHPVTLERETAREQFQKLLNVLEEMKSLRIIFTKANSDTDGRVINQMIDDFIRNNEERSIGFISMGQLRYLSAMKYCTAVVGNSSSGVIEAPSFKVATVNIGDRQKGRIQSESVINCGNEEEEIKQAIELAISSEFKSKLINLKNPYGEGDVSKKIINNIKQVLFGSKEIIKKEFYDLDKEE